jgi:hypothetical protein
MSEVVLDTDTHLETDSGDHDRFAHYVEKSEAVRSMVEGTPTVALCGKVWIPSRDPEKFPICPTCKELHAHLGDVDGND